MVFEKFPVIVGAILRATIRMMNDPWWRLSQCNGLFCRALYHGKSRLSLSLTAQPMTRREYINR